MKYHHREGVTEKDRKGHPKLWITFFVLFALVVYGGFCFATLALNCWPLTEIDQTAKIVKQSKPGSNGDRLFVPAINLDISSRSVAVTGTPGEGGVSIKGNEFGFGITPNALRDASPFFNLSRLKEGDEVFLDSNGVRYAYRIISSNKEENSKNILTLQNGKIEKKAQAIGTVAWKNGDPELEAL